jgi:hypothetical protein
VSEVISSLLRPNDRFSEFDVHGSMYHGNVNVQLKVGTPSHF